MNKDSSILLLGATGMVGRAVVRELRNSGFTQLLTPSHEELDLLRQEDTLSYFSKHKPDYVFMAAAKVGGLFDNNTKRADYIADNLTMQNHVFQAASSFPVKRLLFMSSSCIYPKNCHQPMSEDLLWTGPLEETNSPFATAKLSGLMMAKLSKRPWHGIISCSLYGEDDNFDAESGHVLPGLCLRMLQAKKMNQASFSVWGSGKPRREFLHVEDMARAIVQLFMIDEELPPYFNVGAGIDISIGDLAQLIAQKMNYKGLLVFDPTREDGVYQKLLFSSLLESFGWGPQISLDDGVSRVIHFLQSESNE